MPLDGYEQSRGIYVDKFGNQLTYFNWAAEEPTQTGSLRYIETSEPLSGHWNDMVGAARNVVCMKCSGYYSIPTNYECHDTDFGIVVVKAFTEVYTPTAARDKCTSEANYLHLPIPMSAAQNQWYWNYSQVMGLEYYWLGISDAVVEGEYRTDKGDLQTYFNWANVGVQQPSGRGQHYVATGGSWAPDGTWDDVHPFEKRTILCTYVV